MDSFRLFIRDAAMFLLPLVLVLVGSIYMLVRLGEFTKNETILTWHADGVSYRYGKNYIPSPTEVKDEILRAYPPDVIVIGDSRSSQFRKEFFKDEYRFFAWPQVGSVDDLHLYFDEFITDTTTAPDLVVLVVDHFFLLDRGIADRRRLAGDGIGKPRWLQIFSRVIGDMATGKLPLRIFAQDQVPYHAGAQAVINGVGFRNDGSLDYGNVKPNFEHEDHEDYQFKYYLRLTERGIGNLKQGDTPSDEALQVFEAFLQRARESNIHVVVILPPFAPTIYREMQRPENHYGYIPKAAARVASLTKKYGHAFGDFTNPEILSLPDTSFFDGIHQGEAANARILLEIARTDTTLATYLDEERLNDHLRDLGDARYLFP